jgi:hypothetical protein
MRLKAKAEGKPLKFLLSETEKLPEIIEKIKLLYLKVKRNSIVIEKPKEVQPEEQTNNENEQPNSQNQTNQINANQT